MNPAAVAGIALMLLVGCAAQPTVLDQARALHNSRLQEYAAIQDPEERARMLNLENYRYQQFLAQTGAILEQSARMRMYEAQTRAANGQAAAATGYQTSQRIPSVDEMTGGWRPMISPVSSPTAPGTSLNPIRVQIVPTPTPGTMFAPLPGSY